MMQSLLHKANTLLSAIKTYTSWPIWVLYRFGYKPHREVLFKIRSGEKFMLRVDQGELSPIDSVFREQSYNKYFQVEPNDIVVDIGANIGLYTIYAAKRAPRGKVYAYDPNAEALKRLEKNIALNHVDNVIVDRRAVTSDGRDVKLYFHTVGTVMATIRDSGKNDPRAYSTVHSIPFSDVILGSACTFLKIDCEGAEYELFDTIDLKVLGKVDKIVCEHHWQGCDGIEKKLRAAGFDIVIERTPPFVPEWNSGTIYGFKK